MDTLAQNPLHLIFHLPHSNQAHAQFLQLQESLVGIVVNENPDKWTYIWNSPNFSVHRAYKHLSGHQLLQPAFSWLWNSSCQPKHKVFFWLILKDRLSTRELLKRKKMVLQDFNCILCNLPVEESLIHLFLVCPFAIQCWPFINVQVDQTLNPFQILQSLKDQLHEAFFMEIITLMCWTIWKARNDLIFRQVNLSLNLSKKFFRDEFSLLLLMAKRRYFPRIEQWIANLF